jgi:hypothetical protein
LELAGQQEQAVLVVLVRILFSVQTLRLVVVVVVGTTQPLEHQVVQVAARHNGAVMQLIQLLVQALQVKETMAAH